MARADVFELENSGYNAFLFADVGDDLNGSPVTLLSALARLDRDPWVQAAKWAKLSQAEAVDDLVACIRAMQLTPHALAAAGVTARRLIKLLPMPGSVARAPRARVRLGPLPKWLPAGFVWGVLVLGLLAGAVLVMRPAPAGIAPEGTHITQDTLSH